MIEKQLAERFRAAVADEPPLGFDPDKVVDRAVHALRRRTAVIGASAATTATVAVATVAILQVARTDGSAEIPVMPSTSRPAPTTPSEPCGPPRPSPDPRGDTKRPEPPPFPGSADVIDRLKVVTPQVLEERTEGLRFEMIQWAAASDWRVAAVYCIPGTERFIRLTVIRERSVGLALGTRGPGRLVKETAQPDGSRLRLYLIDAGYDHGQHAVWHYRTDGTIVGVSRDLPERLLTAVATDPRLTF